MKNLTQFSVALLFYIKIRFPFPALSFFLDVVAGWFHEVLQRIFGDKIDVSILVIAKLIWNS